MSDTPTDEAHPGAEPTTASRRARAYSQLLRQQERARRLLQRITDELSAPVTHALLAQLDAAPGERVRRRLEEVDARIGEAARVVEGCESEIHRALVTPQGRPDSAGPSNLPPALARFLAERRDSPGFTYDVAQDPVRGWIVRWKEYDDEGGVCGGGQFYERPFAWLED